MIHFPNGIPYEALKYNIKAFKFDKISVKHGVKLFIIRHLLLDAGVNVERVPLCLEVIIVLSIVLKYD